MDSKNWLNWNGKYDEPVNLIQFKSVQSWVLIANIQNTGCNAVLKVKRIYDGNRDDDVDGSK